MSVVASQTVTTPVLTVEDLSTHLATRAGLVKAVDRVSFQVMPGETLGLVGESGCGKSMTALSILGLHPKPVARIAGGSVRLATGEDLTKLSERALRRIRGGRVSMIFQEPMTSLNPVFTVGRQIVEAIRAHERVAAAEARVRAIGLLAAVGIPSPERRVDAYPHQLSGGMRQRVMIAIALACRPALMLADEPTTALDVTIQAQILQLMRRLQAQTGTAILLITHDLGVIAQMAQHVAVMYAGAVVESASVATLFAQPVHPYTKGLLASLGTGEGRIGRRPRMATIAGSVPSLARLPSGCRFSDRCPSVMERCRREEPPEFELRSGTVAPHRVRCWLAA